MENTDFTQQLEEKIVINHMPVTIRSVDRSFKNIADWWNSIQNAESTYFPNRTDLLDIMATVEIDGHLTGIIEKRIKTTTNKALIFKKGETQVKAMTDFLNLESFKELRKQRFKRYTHGLYGFEFIPGAEFKYNLIPLKHIKPEYKTISKEQYGSAGFNYENVWNIMVYGRRDDLGLLAKCAPYAIWKKGNMGDWAQYVEVFGQPMIVFTYDAHDAKTKAELDNIMRNIGSGTKLQVPKQVELKLEDGKQNNGDGELQDKLRRACNEEMSVLILGVTETTTSSKSSGYAQSVTQAKQQDEVIKDDMDDELKFLNSPEFLNILSSYGYPVEGGKFYHEDEVNADQQKHELEVDEKLEKIGVPLGHDYYYKKYNRPKPANYDSIIADKKAAADKIQKDDNDPADPKPAKKAETKKAKPATGKAAKESLSLFHQARLALANFFDQAHED